MKDREHQQHSDESLAKSGSFDELVHRYTSPLYNFTYRLTSNPQTAEDLVQETLIKAWKNLKSYNPSLSFRAWIFTIARNTTTDYLRKKKAVTFSALSSDDDLPFEQTLTDEEPLPETIVERMENSTYLLSLLDSLPEDHRTVLILHYQENMTFDEIGRVMDKPLNTVKSHHRRALERLRNQAEHDPSAPK